MKALTKILAAWVVFILGLLVGLAMPAGAPDIEGRAQATRALQASVVLVWTKPASPPVMDSFCGGTMVRPDLVLTAAHCVRILPFGGIGVITYRDQTTLVKAVVEGQNPGADLAWLRLEKPVEGRVADLAPDVYPGEGVYVVGAPSVTGEDFRFMLTWGRVGMVRPYAYENGRCFKQLGGIGEGQHQQITLDAVAYYGNSGGGVFNTDGQLVGVLVRGEVADDAECEEALARNFSPMILWSYAVGPETIRRGPTK